MYPILQRWENSGMSQVAFARREGLPQVVFHYWLRKYRDSQNSIVPGFIAVSPSPSVRREAGEQSRSIFARIMLPDGAEVYFHQSVSGRYLREVLGC